MRLKFLPLLEIVRLNVTHCSNLQYEHKAHLTHQIRVIMLLLQGTKAQLKFELSMEILEAAEKQILRWCDEYIPLTRVYCEL